MTNRGYNILRVTRILVSLAVMAAITAAVAVGYGCFLSRMQIVPALLACSGIWLAVWTVVTALIGRIYCSSACPLGTLQDILARWSPRRRRGYFYTPAMRGLRWGITGSAIIAGVLGFAIVVSLLDPYSAFTRIVVYCGLPAFDTLRSWAGQPVARAATVSVASAVIALATLAVVAVFAFSRGRLLCNTVCPVGTLLGALSRYSLYHVDINTDKCIGCGRCVEVCKSSCINPDDHTVDLSRCVVCFNCVSVCPNSAITIRRGRHRLSMPMLQSLAGNANSTACDDPAAAPDTTVKPLDRRAFLAALVAGAASSMSGGGFAPSLRPLNYVIPPGASSRESYESRCTGCGACVAACPTGVLRPSTTQFGWRKALHPVMDFDYGPCRYDCVACTRVCPTGALTPTTPAEKHRIPIGKARVEPELCIMYADSEPCGKCARRCPVGAITIVAVDTPAKTRRVQRLPLVDFDRCIGCGECRWVCPARPRAIIIEGE